MDEAEAMEEGYHPRKTSLQLNIDQRDKSLRTGNKFDDTCASHHVGRKDPETAQALTKSHVPKEECEQMYPGYRLFRGDGNKTADAGSHSDSDSSSDSSESEEGRFSQTPDCGTAGSTILLRSPKLNFVNFSSDVKSIWSEGSCEEEHPGPGPSKMEKSNLSSVDEPRDSSTDGVQASKDSESERVLLSPSEVPLMVLQRDLQLVNIPLNQDNGINIGDTSEYAAQNKAGVKTHKSFREIFREAENRKEVHPGGHSIGTEIAQIGLADSSTQLNSSGWGAGKPTGFQMHKGVQNMSLPEVSSLVLQPVTGVVIKPGCSGAETVSICEVICQNKADTPFHSSHQSSHEFITASAEPAVNSNSRNAWPICGHKFKTLAVFQDFNSGTDNETCSRNISGLEKNISESAISNYPQRPISESVIVDHKFHSVAQKRNQNQQVEDEVAHNQILNLSKSSSSTSKDQLHLNGLAESIQNMRSQNILENSFLKLCFRSEQPNLLLSYPDVENAFKILKNNVKNLENKFSIRTCLSDESLEESLAKIELPLKVHLSQLPAKIQESFLFLQAKLRQEYKDRNTKIRKLESEAIDMLLTKAVDYYSEELKFIVGDNYVTEDNFRKYEEEIHKETKNIFLQAADLKPESWIQKYMTKLDEELIPLTKSLEKLRLKNKKRLETVVDTVMTKGVQTYKNLLSQQKIKQKLNAKDPDAIDTLRSIHKDLSAAVSNYFMQQCKTHRVTRNPDVIDILSHYRNKLLQELEEVLHTEINYVKEERRLLEENKKTNQAVFYKCTSDVNPSKSGSTRYSGSVPGNPHNYEAGVLLSGDQAIPQSVLSWSVPPLPDCDLVLHYGLSRTIAGIVAPGTDEILILHDVSNCIYFDHPHLILSSEDTDRVKYRPSRIPNILKVPCNLIQEVLIDNTKQFMRVEAMIACMFVALKWRIELSQKVKISNCVICIPQCLNQNQRKILEGAAYIAGLRNVTFINDTHAIALAYMLKKEIKKGSFMVANTSEGFVDAAYFQFDHGIVYCPGMTGEYFVKRNYSWWTMEQENTTVYISRIFKGYLPNHGKTDFMKYPYLDGIILTGNNEEFLEEVINILLNSEYHSTRKYHSKHYVDTEDDKTAFYGAAYLSVLNHFSHEHPMCKRWAALARYPTESNLTILKEYLLTQRLKDGLLVSSNPCKSGNLSDEEIREIQQHFILNNRAKLHDAQMLLVRKALLLETYIKRQGEASGEPDEKQNLGLVNQIRLVLTDLETNEFTKDLLRLFHKNLDELFNSVTIVYVH